MEFPCVRLEHFTGDFSLPMKEGLGVGEVRKTMQEYIDTYEIPFYNSLYGERFFSLLRERGVPDGFQKWFLDPMYNPAYEYILIKYYSTLDTIFLGARPRGEGVPTQVDTSGLRTRLVWKCTEVVRDIMGRRGGVFADYERGKTDENLLFFAL